MLESGILKLHKACQRKPRFVPPKCKLPAYVVRTPLTSIAGFHTADNGAVSKKGMTMKMKKVGVTRPIDSLGRAVIPVEIRRMLQWNNRDRLDIYVNERGVFLTKYERSCLFCGCSDHLEEFQNYRICLNCLKELRSLAGESCAK